ncbi:M56 family metallopeptidase [Clostridioides difficile]|uniref:M56 family metallopeptidase n=1 Tax=Clostridioides difficile TaxID=1496 RepID=UPI0010B22447|nr:M56 family metallopeptidase [Clostridioides difficile]UUV14484.1 M56 family metallopeptidase [Clostridioides difficile]VIG04384.1 penicillin-binding peptidase BlaR1-like,M56 family [Clostridioides difficile]
MTLLQMSISAGIMIFLITVIRALTINRLPKKTFLILWGIVLIRLLVPFSWPSPLSVYSLINHSYTVVGETTTANVLPLISSTNIVAESNTSISPFVLVWGIGATICALYFIIVYIKCRLGFMNSQLVENAFIIQWLKEHKIKRPISIRQTFSISSPLTYGIFHPVILVPEQTEWTEIDRLQYILTHEYVHICRFDAITKLLLIIALCLHWFNPFVWVLFILANRDIELSCDEKVIQIFGENIKSAYALTLIGMEENKSGFASLCNNFSKNAIEERIESIMKMRKPTVITLLIMILLVGSFTVVFATSSIKKEKKFTTQNSSIEEKNTMNESVNQAITSRNKTNSTMQQTVTNRNEINGTIVYDKVEVRHYSDGGEPYVFWQRTNATEQSIAKIQFGMLAYDKNGNALNLPWRVEDSSAGYSYDVLCEWEPKSLKSKQQADSNDGHGEGGWSLGWTIDMFNKDTPELRELFEQVEYVLCCDKQITFENGEVWNNPDYNNWLETHKGKTVDIAILHDYYPNELQVKFK